MGELRKRKKRKKNAIGDLPSEWVIHVLRLSQGFEIHIKP
jgi:hypothetical protein